MPGFVTDDRDSKTKLLNLDWSYVEQEYHY